MHVNIEEEYTDVLQNIECVIVAQFECTPDLGDREVFVAIERLISAYEQEKRNRDGTIRVPPGRTREVYDQCRRVCEWRLGRGPLIDGEQDDDDDPQPGNLSVPELLLCLKRLRKSMRLWHKQGGRQGYLRYVREFLPGE